jgi:hypothetical protein
LLTYIVDLTAANPTKKVFLSKTNCTYWCVRAMWVDPVTKADYAYALDNYKPSPDYYGTGFYKIPINADGTANTSGAVKLYSTTNIDESVSVSADGTKIGCAVPWPNTKILDVASGTFTDRHAGGFGCQANIAPDNSYRFFHCGSEHTDIDMFPGLTGDLCRVDLNKNLAGLP